MLPGSRARTRPLTHAVAARRDEPLAVSGLAQLAVTQHRFQTAIPLAREALVLDPENAVHAALSVTRSLEQAATQLLSALTTGSPEWVRASRPTPYRDCAAAPRRPAGCAGRDGAGARGRIGDPRAGGLGAHALRDAARRREPPRRRRGRVPSERSGSRRVTSMPGRPGSRCRRPGPLRGSGSGAPKKSSIASRFRSTRSSLGTRSRGPTGPRRPGARTRSSRPWSGFSPRTVCGRSSRPLSSTSITGSGQAALAACAGGVRAAPGVTAADAVAWGLPHRALRRGARLVAPRLDLGTKDGSISSIAA